MSKSSRTKDSQTEKVPYYSATADRKRLSGPALRRFFKIMERWKIDEKSARLLLGGMSSTRFRQLKARPKGSVLNPDQLLRIICIATLDESLGAVLPKRQVNQWAQTPTMSLPGGTPLYGMIHGGTTTLWTWSQSLQKQASEFVNKQKS